MKKFNLYSIDKMTGWWAGYFTEFWQVVNSLKRMSRWFCHHMVLKYKSTQSGPFFWYKPHMRNRHMIIFLECDLPVKMPSFYLQFAILKTKCIISQQETTEDDEGHKICSNKLSLFNMFDSSIFVFFSWTCSPLFTAAAQEKTSTLCAGEICHMITWRKLKWYTM